MSGDGSTGKGENRVGVQQGKKGKQGMAAVKRQPLKAMTRHADKIYVLHTGR